MTEDSEPRSVDEALAPMREMQNLLMSARRGVLSEKGDHTVEGEFPGSRTRAMGHALAAKELVEEHTDCTVEREYVGEMEGYEDLHRIDLRVTCEDPASSE